MPRAVPARPVAARLFTGAAFGLALVVFLCATAIAAYVAALNAEEGTIAIREQASDWLTALLDAETGVRGYVASNDAIFLAPYQPATAREREKASILRALVAGEPTQRANVDVADRDALDAMASLETLVALVRSGARAEALARLDSGESKARMDAFRADVTVIRSEEQRRLTENRAAVTSRGILSLIGAALVALASFGLLVIARRRESGHDRSVTALAIDARARLRALSDLTAALSEARSRSQVADVVVEHGFRAVAADTCTLYALDESGTALELIGDRGVAPEVLERLRRITATSGNPGTFTALEAGRAIWAESDADYAKVYPELANLKAEGRRARAFWSVPLVAEGRSLGLLGVGYYAPRTFSEDERTFVRTLAGHCAQALLRASRLEREEEARQWLQTTLRSIGDAVIATDDEGRVTFMNPVAESLTGWPEADARGRPVEEIFCIFSEQTGAPAEGPVARVLREGAVVGLANHTVLRSRRGIDVPIDDSGAPIRNESGELFGVVLVFRDVAVQKRALARTEFLARAGETLATSIDYESTLATVARFAVPALADWCSVELVEPGAASHRQVAVAHVDPNKVRFARELGERYPPDRSATTGVPQVIRSGKSELYSEIPRELLERSARDDEHLRIIRDLRLESAMVVPLRVRGVTRGAMTFVYAESGRRYTPDDLAFAEDFARRAGMAIENALALKETEEARAREGVLRAEAEGTSRAKDEFLATVSHELRTPLNAILGWTVTLRRRKVPEDVDRALAIVERNARQQTKLVEDVLDVSRIISGKLALNLAPTRVAEAVSAAIETVTPAAEAKEIRISSDVADESLTLLADPDRLQQIVWNLLSNAVKFTPKGGSVVVRAHREGSDVFIAVKDTGEGIRREVLPLVFERFHQADASITRRHGGLGLGLAIVKHLVSAHGGTVRAESQGEGHGATFTVQLVARAAVPAVSAAARPSGALPAASRTNLESPRLEGLRLLVVDDEEDALGLVSEVLSELGAEVHAARSASEALEMFARLKPDVIVSDIGMPGTDGLSLIRTIRALPSTLGGRTPAVALTAYARSEDARRAFAAGYQTHVAKPVEPSQLATVVANLGGRSLDGA